MVDALLRGLRPITIVLDFGTVINIRKFKTLKNLPCFYADFDRNIFLLSCRQHTVIFSLCLPIHVRDFAKKNRYKEINY